MLKKGEHILYGTVDVCQVESILKPDFSNNDKVYYSFVPEFDQDTAVYIPVGSPKVRVREIMIGQEAEQFVPALPSVACKRCASDRERPQVCRQVLESGGCVELTSMVREISEMEQHRRGEGKPLPIHKRDGVKNTRKLLLGELATALDICPEEIPDYITSQIRES